jgi:hypothetical protein
MKTFNQFLEFDGSVLQQAQGAKVSNSYANAATNWMSEDEINEFLGLFNKKPEVQKGRLNRPEAPIIPGKAHSGEKIGRRQAGEYDGIDPHTVPEFKPTVAHTVQKDASPKKNSIPVFKPSWQNYRS